MKYFLSLLLTTSLFLPGCAPTEISQKPLQDYNQIILSGSRKDEQGHSSYKHSYHIVLDSNGNPKAITKDFGSDPIVVQGYEKEFPNARRMSLEQLEELKELTKANRDFIYKMELLDSKRNNY